ncbi:MAG: hypothetical protein A3H72_01245 [Candidatus Doudnabacteria bacterium RIFCSPLOWO2_02_FULL_48_8]|uniref:Transcriptional repressor PaaX-like central Cas2-like domain-containing protein n=1 Tax=Candidatus Doudnabacteria bacterium RIFCSPHIGHO2_01_FULL_46_24 TaxID=1817825 RepID=A0A1F5NV53_9BACT|nr:MAG: hypothetical protein A2720_02795 [Candidatus Doudnabacteria bacterium RIFCSPHIGHO2_01_FULL_46_24]OGE95023.1 MAG: hypothetical protein A3H72_01245 [Candidatus Doudnabacteria bacterium RIFCSPLOWO2_02_FULL_48_8]OGE95937.1 MAG: hypothetical protein A3E98_00620 [Candidatus Doudnabacteria bacterium RIFCSPHIGHO2_12_FULL_48_11]
MQIVEKEKRSKAEIIKMILTVIAAAGFVVAVAVLPGLPMALAPFLGKTQKRYQPWQIRRSLKSMEDQNLISITEERHKTVIKMTKNGKQKLLKFKMDKMQIKPQKTWDKKWRLVMFDIPKQFKRNSYYFTRQLKEIGFYPMQKSVWACPYPCEDEVDFLKEIYEIDRYVRIAIVQELDFQNDLLKKFGLKV